MLLERLPTRTQLLVNYPNPFNPETWIPYHLSHDAEVVVRIYDARGRIIRTLDMGFQSFGYYASRDKAAYWNGKTDTGAISYSHVGPSLRYIAEYLGALEINLLLRI